MSWFDVPATQMSIFILFESVGVVIEGAFSLWVSLTFQGFFSIILLYGEDIVSYILLESSIYSIKRSGKNIRKIMKEEWV